MSAGPRRILVRPVQKKPLEDSFHSEGSHTEILLKLDDPIMRMGSSFTKPEGEAYWYEPSIGRQCFYGFFQGILRVANREDFFRQLGDLSRVTTRKLPTDLAKYQNVPLRYRWFMRALSEYLIVSIQNISSFTTEKNHEMQLKIVFGFLKKRAEFLSTTNLPLPPGVCKEAFTVVGIIANGLTPHRQDFPASMLYHCAPGGSGRSYHFKDFSIELDVEPKAAVG